MNIGQMLKIRQTNPKGILRAWGKFRFMYGHASFYIGALQLGSTLIILYNTTARDWALSYLGIHLSFWVYGVFLLITSIIGIVGDYVISVPSLIAESNEQMYKHKSPIQSDFEEVKACQNDHGRKLDLIMKHLGIEDEEVEDKS